MMAAHAHLPSLPEGACLPSASASSPFNSSRAGECISAPNGPVGEQAHSIQRNARRFQLRGLHGAFRPSTSDVATHQVSPRRPLQAPNVNVPRDRGRTREEVAGAPREQARPNSSPASILQEISNHATPQRVSGRSLLTSIFSHSSADLVTKSGFTVVDENTNLDQSSQADAELQRAKMRSPEKKRSPSSANHGRSFGVRGTTSAKLQRKSVRSANRSAGWEANKYIEHLESELASVNAKLDDLASPSTSRAQNAKFRALNRQNQSLRQEVADWEKNFADRIDAHVSERADFSLQANITELKDEIHAKDVRTADLQRDLDTMRDKLAASEALETDLSRRIDVLTELLAQSPTRSSFQAASPTIRADSTKRASRPASMILPTLRTMTSYQGRPDTQTPSRLSRRESDTYVEGTRMPESATSSSSRVKEQLLSDELQSMSPNVERSFLLPETEADSKECCDLSLSDTSRIASELSSMTSAPSSRPTSFMSNSSIWSAWGVSIAPDISLKSEAKSRKMRRFMAGSTTLKPLLLPTTTMTSDEFTSLSPVSMSPDRWGWSPSREVATTPFSTSTDSWDNVPREERSLPVRPIEEITDTWGAPDKSKRPDLATESQDLNSSEDFFYRRLLAAPRSPLEIKHGSDSPTIASSPLGGQTQAPNMRYRSDVRTPVKAARDPEQASPASPSTARTIRIQTPSPNLDTLLMDCTPSGTAVDACVTVCAQDQLLRHSSRQVSPRACNGLPNARLYQPGLSDRVVDRITRLIMSLKRETLLNMKNVLMRSWITGSSGFGALGWWLIGVARSPRPSPQSSPAGSAIKEGFLGMTWPSIWSFNADTHEPQSSPEEVKRVCQGCVEPPLKRDLRLWCKFSLAICLAIGIAIIKGPGTLIEDGECVRLACGGEESSTQSKTSLGG